MRKQILLIAALVLFIGILGGSMLFDDRKPESPARNDILQQMEEHLSKKYGEFPHQSVQVLLNGWDHPYDLCYMYPDNSEDPIDRFWVRRYKNDDGSYTFTDNYYWQIIRDEYEARMTEKLSSLFPNCKVYLGTANADALSNNITIDTTLDEMLAGEVPKHSFWVIVDGGDFSEISEFTSLNQDLLDIIGRGNCSVRVMLMKTLDYENANRYNRYLSINDQRYLAEIGRYGPKPVIESGMEEDIP